MIGIDANLLPPKGNAIAHNAPFDEESRTMPRAPAIPDRPGTLRKNPTSLERASIGSDAEPMDEPSAAKTSAVIVVACVLGFASAYAVRPCASSKTNIPEPLDAPIKVTT